MYTSASVDLRGPLASLLRLRHGTRLLRHGSVDEVGPTVFPTHLVLGVRSPGGTLSLGVVIGWSAL
jgi:hypothetical protein